MRGWQLDQREQLDGYRQQLRGSDGELYEREQHQQRERKRLEHERVERVGLC